MSITAEQLDAAPVESLLIFDYGEDDTGATYRKTPEGRWLVEVLNGKPPRPEGRVPLHAAAVIHGWAGHSGRVRIIPPEKIRGSA